MAIRERKGRKSPWQVYWNNPFTGRRECANFATKEEAEKEDSLVKHRLKFERESFRPENMEADQEEVKELTLEQAYFLYLREKKFNKKSLAPQLVAMRLVLQQLGTKPVNEISKEDICDISRMMDKQPIKQVTRHGRLSVFRALINWCVEKDYRAPIRFPRLTKGQYQKFIPPSPEEMRNMLAAAPDHIQRVIILGSQCGIRVGSSELFRLTWDDVDFELQIIRVQSAHKNPAAPWREIPVRKSISGIIRQWHEEDMLRGISHVINFNGKPVCSIKNAWTTMLKNAGINRRIRPYDLRHSFATELIAQGVDIGTVAKLMGHSSPNMIYQHYQYVMDKQKRAAVETLPDFAHVPKQMCPNKKGVTEFQ